MDNEIVYRKTAAGEQAMQQRKRLMQRNLRMVLILVDGVSPVAELSKKTGDAQLTANALGELLQGGFIEPLPVREDLGQKIVQALGGGERAAEKEKLAVRSGGAVTAKADSAVKPSEMHQKPAHAEAGPSESSLWRRLMGNGEAKRHPVRQGSKQPEGRGDAMKESELSSLSTFSQAPKPTQTQTRKNPAPANASRDRLQGKIDRSEASFQAAGTAYSGMSGKGGHKAEADNPEFKRRLVRLRANTKGRWWGVLLLLCVVLGIGVSFFPYERYVPQIEQKLTAIVGNPVRFEGFDVVFKPRPTVVLKGVRFGDAKDVLRAEEIRLEAVSAVALLFSETWRIDTLHVSGVDFGRENVIALPGLLTPLSKADAPVSVRRFSFEKSSLALLGLRLEKLEGEFLSDPAGLGELKLHSADRALSLSLKPASAGPLALSLEAYAWQPVPDAGIQIDSLSLSGVVKPQELEVSSFDVRILNGAFRGQGRVSKGEAYSVSGNLDFEHLNAGKLSEILAGGAMVQGEASGEIAFSARSPTWQELFARIEADGRFSFGRGSLRGIDFVEAVRRSGAAVQGGMTAFEQLSGRFRARQGGMRLSDLSMGSGLMQSRGVLDIVSEGGLQGRFELQLKGSANQTRVPIVVNGTVKSPVVQMSR